MRIARQRVAFALVAVGGALALVGVPTLYVRGQVLDRPQLESRLANAVHSREVRRVAAQHIVDGFADAGVRDVLAVRALLVPAIEAFLDSPPFDLVVRAAARDVHTRLIQDRDESLVLDIAAGGAKPATALRSVSPSLARAIPADVDPPIVELDSDAPALVGLRRLADARALGVLLPLAALAALLAALAAPRRRLLALAPRWRSWGL